MRYKPLPAELHAGNRTTFAASIGDAAIAIIDTADQLTRPGDYEYPFRPDSNFYYLTGIDEPEAVLVLVPGHANAAGRELLFTSGTSDHVGQWQGDRLTPEQATERSGIKTVLPLDQLGFYLGRLLEQYQTIYLNAPESVGSVMPHPAKRRAAQLREHAPLHQLKSALPQLGRQRTVKDPAEVTQIRQAIAQTQSGLTRAWEQLKPGIHEYELEAEFIAGSARAGALGSAFLPIVATGANATVIHYTHNQATVAASDLVLFDVGAEAGYYAADISRTVPATGRFTARQRAVYEAVYRALQTGLKLHKPGTSLVDIDSAMRDVLGREIKQLGLSGPLETYYPHMSHHLGLDVHDTGGSRLKFEPGMVVTCEPGLYLREEGIGMRIEDDLLITETGAEVLSRHIPSDPDELEALLQKGAQ